MKFSIITPTYNSHKTLRATIDSVLSQEDVELEYLIVDGSSNDGTLDIIKKYAAQDARIHWVSEPDEGIADAFNKGLAMASGDWIGILNSDDLYTSETLVIAAESIRHNPDADVIHGDMVRLDEKGNALFLLRPAEIETVIWRQMPLNHPATFVSRRAYEQVGRFDDKLKVAMDYELILRLFLAGKKFCYIDKVLAKMSYGGASDEYFIDVRKEVYMVTVKHGYPRYKAMFWFVDNVFRGFCKGALRRSGLHGLLRLHPRFHKGDT